MEAVTHQRETIDMRNADDVLDQASRILEARENLKRDLRDADRDLERLCREFDSLNRSWCTRVEGLQRLITLRNSALRQGAA